ncbi:MAG: hydrogenase maturation protease [Anaerolineae bacterium]|nr:hydrogenase maturation protease [Anaerolineae bacterium]
MLARESSGFQPRLAILGVGHPFLRDDRAGSLVIQEMKKLVKSGGADDRLLLIDAATSPENFLGPILRHQPTNVVLVDAVDLGKAPGTTVHLTWSPDVHLDAKPFSLPLDKFCLFLTAECGCVITIIGIQAASIGYGTTVSSPVLSAVSNTAQSLLVEWREAVSSSPRL